MTHYAKLAFNCNDLPRDVEHNEAFFRRFLIIPFDETIPEAERNPNLANEIISGELSGVFNWILQGLKRLLEQGKFSECDAAKRALDQYKSESDNVALFVEEMNYQKVTTKDQATLLRDIYAEYKTFCSDCGFRAVSTTNLRKRLETLGFECIKINRGKIVFGAKF